MIKNVNDGGLIMIKVDKFIHVQALKSRGFEEY